MTSMRRPRGPGRRYAAPGKSLKFELPTDRGSTHGAALLKLWWALTKASGNDPADVLENAASYNSIMLYRMGRRPTYEIRKNLEQATYGFLDPDCWDYPPQAVTVTVTVQDPSEVGV